MDNNEKKKNNHNLEDAGKTLGQVFSVNSYDEKADRSDSVWKTIKKVLLIALVAFCAIYVFIAIVFGGGLRLR